MKLALALVALLAAPAFADYEAGFGYQAAPSYSSPRYGYGSGYHRRQLPRREVTTVTPLENGGTRIETRRYYRSGGTARMKTSSGRWSSRSR